MPELPFMWLDTAHSSGEVFAPRIRLLSLSAQRRPKSAGVHRKRQHSRRASFLVAVAALSGGVLAVGLLALLQPDPTAQHNPARQLSAGSHGRGWSADHAKKASTMFRGGRGGAAARPPAWKAD